MLYIYNMYKMEKFGFWSEINKPVVTTITYKKKFIDNLKLLQKCIDNFNTFDTYLFELQLKISDRCEPNIYFNAYTGYSYCRLCNKQDNGDKDIILVGKNKTICIPDGYLHYIFEHNINISEDFENFIIEFDFIKSMTNIDELIKYYNENKSVIQHDDYMRNIFLLMSNMPTYSN